MAVSAWFMVTFTLRRWALAVIALVGTTSTLLPFSPNIEAVYALRILQGFAGGLMTPLLMSTALASSGPPIRLYGLAVYALTATFVPAFAPTVSSFWSDVVHWPLPYYQGCRSARSELSWSGTASRRTIRSMSGSGSSTGAP